MLYVNLKIPYSKALKKRKIILQNNYKYGTLSVLYMYRSSIILVQVKNEVPYLYEKQVTCLLWVKKVIN